MIGATVGFPRLNSSISPASFEVFFSHTLLIILYSTIQLPFHLIHICLNFSDAIFFIYTHFWFSITTTYWILLFIFFDRTDLHHLHSNTYNFFEFLSNFIQDSIWTTACYGSGGLVSLVWMTAEHYQGGLIATDLVRQDRDGNNQLIPRLSS